MARRRTAPKELSDAVREAVEKTVQATVGQASLTRDRAQEVVDELVKGAEAGADAVRGRVRDAEAGAGAVRQRVRGALEERRPATSDDIKELRRELRAIARRLEAIEDRLPPPRRTAARSGRSGSGRAPKRSGAGKRSS